MKSLCKLMFALVLLCGSLCAQTITGPTIPDATAERLYALNLTNMSTAQQTDYFTNDVQLAPSDITPALTLVTQFQASYSAAVNTYNTAIGTDGSGLTTGVLTTFQNAQTSATTAFMNNAALTLSPQDYTSLVADIEAAKNNMFVGDGGGGSMSGWYSMITQYSMHVLTTKPFHATVTMTQTLDGNVPFNVEGVTHQGSLSIKIDGHVASYTGAKVPTDTYMDYSAALTLDSATDDCLLSDDGCPDLSQYAAQVECSEVGTVAQDPGPQLLEIAYTRVIYLGTYSGCSVVSGATWCNFNVANWCTPSTTPPDNDFTGAAVWYKQVPLNGFYETWAPGVNLGGVWYFSKGVAVGDGLIKEPYGVCTKNPQ